LLLVWKNRSIGVYALDIDFVGRKQTKTVENVPSRSGCWWHSVIW